MREERRLKSRKMPCYAMFDHSIDDTAAGIIESPNINQIR